MARREILKREIVDDAAMQEARAYRASLHKPQPHKLSDKEKRDLFKMYWAKERKSYKASKNLEDILWAYLKKVKMEDPSKFDDGLKRFGLKKLK